jgi:hypothetical protein
MRVLRNFGSQLHRRARFQQTAKNSPAGCLIAVFSAIAQSAILAACLERRPLLACSSIRKHRVHFKAGRMLELPARQQAHAEAGAVE